MTNKKFAVLLSGCGSGDGSEITEVVSVFVTLSELNVEYECFALNSEFMAISPLTQKSLGLRNSMEEAARISRGRIRDIKDLKSVDFDALVIPGGHGITTVFSNWAEAGGKCTVKEEVERVLKEFRTEEKPMCAICIAPVLLARLFGKEGIVVTVGSEVEVIKEILKTSSEHEICPIDDFITDRDHKIICTPAYMYAGKPHQVFRGIQRALKECYEMA